MELVSRFFAPPSQSFFLFGPRGTGKSTLLRHAYEKAITVNLLEPETFRTYSSHPEHLRERLSAEPADTTVVIDEVQRVPEMLPVVHDLIEKEGRRRRFVLTGSSARKLRRAGSDLLAGRVLLRTLHPFMAAELGNRFRLREALQTGLLPVVMDSPSPSETLRSYAALYLREEVQMEGLVRNIGNFARFLEVVSFSHASLLNVSTVGRDCEVERKVVEAYIGVLEDLLLACRLPVFTKRARRTLVVHPKFYLFDAGVYRSLRPAGPLDRPEEVEGQALEGLVAQHLKAWLAYSGSDAALSFWRTRGGVEVDFVVYGAAGIFAFEVKNASRIHPQDLRGLQNFREDYPEAKAVLLYRGRERLVKSDVLCLPCDEFLLGLDPRRPLVDALPGK
jgi:uncharacterized protein